MYLSRLLLGPALGHRLCFLAVFLYQGFPLNAAPSALNSPYCDGVYGNPLYSDCTKVLSKLPQDKAVHYFVEQQLRIVPPQADWPPFKDPRPWPYEEAIVQIPKWWSHGTCNIALLGHKFAGAPPYAMSWSKIVKAGALAATTCGASYRGGASLLYEENQPIPAMSIFVWCDGAEFDSLMNGYMGWEFPPGIDPTNTASLLSNMLLPSKPSSLNFSQVEGVATA